MAQEATPNGAMKLGGDLTVTGGAARPFKFRSLLYRPVGSQLHALHLDARVESALPFPEQIQRGQI